MYLRLFFRLLMTAAFFLSFSTVTAFAESFENQESLFSNKRIKLELFTDITKVRAREYVYIGSYKLSELIWDTKRAYMFGGKLGVEIFPSYGISINADVSTIAAKTTSTMDDYDWLWPGRDWTHWSHHNNTKLEKGFIGDISISKRLTSMTTDNFDISVSLGYRRDQWKWTAVGGTYIYSAFPGYRNLSGVFPNVPGISYEQTLDTPYLGFNFDWDDNDFILSADLSASTYVSAKAVDHHYMRSLVFTDKFKGGKMLGGDFTLAYRFSKNAKFGLFYSFQSYLQNRGNTTMFDQITNTSSYFPDSAAMSLNYQSFGISGKCYF